MDYTPLALTPAQLSRVRHAATHPGRPTWWHDLGSEGVLADEQGAAEAAAAITGTTEGPAHHAVWAVLALAAHPEIHLDAVRPDRSLGWAAARADGPGTGGRARHRIARMVQARSSRRPGAQVLAVYQILRGIAATEADPAPDAGRLADDLAVMLAPDPSGWVSSRDGLTPWHRVHAAWSTDYQGSQAAPGDAEGVTVTR